MRSALLSETLGSVAANVRRLRAKRGMTQKKLAETAELDLSYLQRIERASANASIGTLVSVAEALGVRPAKLLAKAEPPVIRSGRPPSPLQRRSVSGLRRSRTSPLAS